MASIVSFDCSTGEAAVRDMTTEEADSHQRLQAAAARHQQYRQAEDAARAATLTRLAQNVGLDVDDLKAALNLGQS